MKKINFKIRTLVIVALLNIQSLAAYTKTETFEKYPNEYFIETGSYMGGGIQQAIDAGFKKTYSIELDPSLYKHNCKRFKSFPFVNLVLGDSSDMLPIVLKKIDAPATFWLDGHYSGGVTARGKSNIPILAELEHIAQHHIKSHTILIDDVRDFGTIGMDFITLDEVLEKIQSINPNYEFLFEDGFIANDVLVAIVRN